MQRAQPILLLRSTIKRDVGRKAQKANIQAGKSVSDIITTTLGHKSMLKMLLDGMGGIVLTNDGNAILREVDVSHPAAKNMIELSRAQDEEVGDGTTSVVILAGQLLSEAEFLLEQNIHPTQIVAGYMKALEDILKILESISINVNLADEAFMTKVIMSCLDTKFSSSCAEKLSQLALQAVKVVCVKDSNQKKNIDIKKYAKVEKIPGGDLENSEVLNGIMVNKDITHPKMKRRIVNPKIVLLDCPLEYKKGESQTVIEITDESVWEQILNQEEKEIEQMCDHIKATGCNVVITEKGISDLAQHFLVKAGISAIRRVRKTDNNRLSRVCGATIVTRPEELVESDVGTLCKLFEVRKIGDEYYSYFTECDNPHACTVILRGGSKDVLNEVERNFQDALNVCRNLYFEPKLLPGGGAVEMELAARLIEKSSEIKGVSQFPYKAVAKALEIIPRVLIQNCGADVVRTMTKLRSQHVNGNNVNIGINGETGEIINVVDHNILDTYSVKQQMFKTAIEAASMLMRIDDILSASSDKEASPKRKADQDQDYETFGDSRDG